MHVITITTANYVLNARRLVQSLKCIHPGLRVVVYAEDASVAGALNGVGAEVEVLPAIATLGVKRAKFAAYAAAALQGGFTYLDADIIVLRELGELLAPKRFTACRDDLRECPFIADPQRPWAGAPDLRGDVYFNSGVFAVPDGFADLFASIEMAAADDGEWARFTVPGKLFDNHFLCAKIAQRGIEVDFLCEYEYNWQGFRSGAHLNCYVDEAGHLRSRHANELLRLVHFAGVADIEAYLGALPIDVAEVLARALGGTRTGCLEMLSAALNLVEEGAPRHSMIAAQALALRPRAEVGAVGAERPLLGNIEALASIVHSCDEADCLWNGLPCGSAYLSAAEYYRLREFVSCAQIESVLEFGAGYTTTLFARAVKSQVAIDSHAGPWLQFAWSQGCDARLLSFSEREGFAEAELLQCARDAFAAGGRKLIFLDAPQGTARRAIVARQIALAFPDIDFVAVHDSIRDASVVYALCRDLGLRVLGHVDSLRGLTFLGREGLPVKPAGDEHSGLAERVARMRFGVNVLNVGPAHGADGLRDLTIELANNGQELLSAATDDLRFSLHVFGASGEPLVWDTTRYCLPVDLRPADSLTFGVAVPAVVQGTDAVIAFDFVREGQFWWSGIAGARAPSVSWPRLCASSPAESRAASCLAAPGAPSEAYGKA